MNNLELEDIAREKASDDFFKAHKASLRLKNDIRDRFKEWDKKFEETLQLYGKIYGPAALSNLRDIIKKNLSDAPPEADGV